MTWVAESLHQHTKAIITADAREAHAKKFNLPLNFATSSSLELLCNLVLMATNVLIPGMTCELKQNTEKMPKKNTQLAA